MGEFFNNDNSQIFTGTVRRISYKNETNGYTVAEVYSDKESVTVVGLLPFLCEGDLADFHGKFIVHSTYGKQFSAVGYEKKIPQNTAAILRYLSSGAIRGIGPATATKIVEKFGQCTLDIIQNSPKELTLIKGISLQKAINISEEYNKKFGVRDIMLMLSKYKITVDKALSIYKKFGDKSTEVIKSNPYLLCEEGIDIRFETVEDIAFDLDFKKDSEQRISAGLEYVLRKNLANGHSCLPRNKFISVTCRLLECKESVVEVCCDRLIETMRLSSDMVGETEFIAIPSYRFAEQHIAARLLSVMDSTNNAVEIDESEVQNIENELGIKLEELQREAIFEAFKSGILILTGGPGTGKTTTLNAIIKLFENRGFKIELAAPTGRAAKRMSELTGMEAKTIHRLLEAEWGIDEKRCFMRNEKNPLKCDVIILDEVSMIDSLLFYDLLKALKLSCKIILVGDSHQLPSIGPGNVLGDILASNKFPSIKLKKVFRQSSESDIILNAHAIINNKSVDFSKRNSDFFFLQREDRLSAVSTVIELITERLPAAYNINPLTDVQILCPSKMLDTGAININNLLQEKFNPNKNNAPQINLRGFYLRKGDKVMQIKNNYDLQYIRNNGDYGTGVFNGEVGFISDIDMRSYSIEVKFEDKTATYCHSDLSQLELAYAITVHKSQGSEYDYVILPLFEVPQKLKYRNLLYTAVTRAKKNLICVGRVEVWQEMVLNDKKNLRYTLLKEFL